MAQIIDGKAVAAAIRHQLTEEVSQLKRERGTTPGLAVIRVGEDPASKTYVGTKRRAAQEIGFNSWEFIFDAETSQEIVLRKIDELNRDPAVHGILVQLPMPKHLDANQIISAVLPEKDADGFHPVNAGKLVLGQPAPRACTPAGIMRLIETTNTKIAGKKAVIVGRSNIVGKPMALLLLAADATVTICHRQSNLRTEVPQADILIAAVGVNQLIKGDWIKQGAVVIDVGMNRDPEGKLVGDVEFEAASARASHITPVPGGVGPMTVAMLMYNTLQAAVKQAP